MTKRLVRVASAVGALAGSASRGARSASRTDSATRVRAGASPTGSVVAEPFSHRLPGDAPRGWAGPHAAAHSDRKTAAMEIEGNERQSLRISGEPWVCSTVATG